MAEQIQLYDRVFVRTRCRSGVVVCINYVDGFVESLEVAMDGYATEDGRFHGGETIRCSVSDLSASNPMSVMLSGPPVDMDWGAAFNPRVMTPLANKTEIRADRVHLTPDERAKLKEDLRNHYAEIVPSSTRCQSLIEVPCPDCNGTGEYVGLNVVETCKACDGRKVGKTVTPPKKSEEN